MNTKQGKSGNIMLEHFMYSIQEKLKEENEQAIKISYNDLKEALDEVGKDLIYNYFIFEKGVSFETFIHNLKVYLGIMDNINKK
ncbi:hypothetical protein [Brassicibacter mesophilus]|uniref:hypothetical protein n=1 Tax=Brassicibacter mesophilus TaxID=745119 RepID=UPI003D23CD56